MFGCKLASKDVIIERFKAGGRNMLFAGQIISIIIAVMWVVVSAALIFILCIAGDPPDGPLPWPIEYGAYITWIGLVSWGSFHILKSTFCEK